MPQICLANRAGVAVVHKNGEVKKNCVDFSGSMSGVDLLNRAGLNPKTDRNFIIEIDGETAANGWTNKSSNDYWFYWNRFAGDWQYSHVGAASNQIVDGELDGWQIGGGQSVNPVLSNLKFADVCPTPIATTSVLNSSPIASSTEGANNTPSISAPVSSNPVQTSATVASAQLETANSVNVDQTSTPGSVKGQKTQHTTLSYVYIYALIAIASIASGFVLFRAHKSD